MFIRPQNISNMCIQHSADAHNYLNPQDLTDKLGKHQVKGPAQVLTTLTHPVLRSGPMDKQSGQEQSLMALRMSLLIQQPLQNEGRPWGRNGNSCVTDGPMRRYLRSYNSLTCGHFTFGILNSRMRANACRCLFYNGPKRVF